MSSLSHSRRLSSCRPSAAVYDWNRRKPKAQMNRDNINIKHGILIKWNLFDSVAESPKCSTQILLSVANYCHTHTIATPNANALYFVGRAHAGVLLALSTKLIVNFRCKSSSYETKTIDAQASSQNEHQSHLHVDIHFYCSLNN